MRIVTLLFVSLTLLLSTATSAEVDIDPGEYVVFYHHDVLGSPVTATNELGQVIWHERTESYGKSEGRVSQNGNPFGDNALPAGNSRQGYTGHTLDNSAGLTYMKARYYDHNIGRFLSNDPVSFYSARPISFNRYAYSGNNPYRYVDPNGKDFLQAYKNPATAMAVAGWGARVGSRGARNPWTAAAVAAFTGTAAATGYGLHKLSVLMSENAEDAESSEEATAEKDGEIREETKEEAKARKKHAPVQKPPYSTHTRYNEDGTIHQTTTYDEYGRRHRQYDLDDKRHGEHQHDFDNYSQGKPDGDRSTDHKPINE